MATKILLIYTGGTIGMAKDYNDQSLKPFEFHNILQKIPELSLLDSEIDSISFKNPIDSSDINIAHWVQLAKMIEENYKTYDGFVVLHGTDTMAYTASALSFMISGLRKPIIFTGSQLPIGDLRTDAKENLLTSIHFASLQHNGEPMVQEVCLYFEYKLFRANRTTKINAEHFDAFDSPNFPNLGESGINLEVKKHELWKEPAHVPFTINTNLDANVGLLKIFPGMSVDFIKNAFKTKGLKAMIIEAFGSGNVFTNKTFFKILEQKSTEGMHIIINTQCVSGVVELGRYQTSEIFQKIQAISSYDLTTEAAITKTFFLLGQSPTNQMFKAQYEQNLRGEISI